MTKRRIIPTKIRITKQGEIKFFQVKIPFDAISIIGIETAMRVRSMAVPSAAFPVPGIGGGGIDVSPPPASGFPNSFVGELKLQSNDDSNVFYTTNIHTPVVRESFDRTPNLSFLPYRVWTHGYKRELEIAKVDANTTVIAGLYKDRFGEMQKRDINYDVFLYVWYKYESAIKK